MDNTNDKIVDARPAIYKIDELVTTRWLWIVAGYAVLHVAAWTLAPLIIHRVPPTDNYEQLHWAEHLAWGYDKHPPLPTMLLWVFEQVFPTSLSLTYALGGLQVATMLAVVWWLTRQLLDTKRALLAVLLVSCVTYYTNRQHFYNHNTALLVACAMSVGCAFKAAQTGRWLWYALLGASWGLGLLCKYQMVIAIACNLIFIVWVRRADWPKLVGRTMVASCVCALVIAPHFIWLMANHFPSFHYAAKFVAANLPLWQRPLDVTGFLLDQLMRVVPVGLVLLVLRRLPSVRAAAADQLPMPDASALAPSLLAVHTWGPLVLMSALSLLFGTDLQMHWGTAFIWVAPIWLLRTQFGKAITTLPIKTLVIVFSALQVVMLLVFR